MTASIVTIPALHPMFLALGGEAAAPGSALILPYALSFLGISLAVAFVTSAISSGERRLIARECTRFFVSIALGIAIFSLIVGALQWLLIGPLV
jgi:hypothetical protein